MVGKVGIDRNDGGNLDREETTSSEGIEESIVNGEGRRSREPAENCVKGYQIVVRVEPEKSD